MIYDTRHCKQISPQSSEITAYLAELTVEETNYTLQCQMTAETHFPALAKSSKEVFSIGSFVRLLVEQVFGIVDSPAQDSKGS